MPRGLLAALLLFGVASSAAATKMPRGVSEASLCAGGRCEPPDLQYEWVADIQPGYAGPSVHPPPPSTPKRVASEALAVFLRAETVSRGALWRRPEGRPRIRAKGNRTPSRVILHFKKQLPPTPNPFTYMRFARPPARPPARLPARPLGQVPVAGRGGLLRFLGQPAGCAGARGLGLPAAGGLSVLGVSGPGSRSCRWAVCSWQSGGLWGRVSSCARKGAWSSCP